MVKKFIYKVKDPDEYKAVKNQLLEYAALSISHFEEFKNWKDVHNDYYLFRDDTPVRLPQFTMNFNYKLDEKIVMEASFDFINI
jgi:hypothetical protein